MSAVGCTEKHQLLDAFGVATQRLSQTVARYGGSLDLSAIEREQAERVIEEARQVYRQTMAALATHLLQHGC